MGAKTQQFYKSLYAPSNDKNWISKIAPAKKRSLWLGIVTACATGGQLLIVPLSQTLLSTMDWVVALVALALIAGLIIPMAYSMSAAVTLHTGRDTEIDSKEAIGEAAEEVEDN